jgi:phage I-like protein
MAHRAALNFELAVDGAPPEWIEILSAGQIVQGRDGRAWINDRPDIVIQAFVAEGKDLPIDWEHSTELKAPVGEQAPAAGWIKELQIRDGGSIWGRVEWTPNGAESLMNKEYRYLSPVFRYEIDSRRIFRITSCGLTNQPNLFLNALNSAINKEDQNMNLQELLASLGLPATATFQDAMNRITAMKGEHATALNQAQNPPLDKFVPRGDYDTALNRATAAETDLKKIKDTQLETAINSEIDQALKDGKITPATKGYHVAQCRMEGGLERFKEFVKAAPVIGGDSGLDNKDPNKNGTALNAEELKIAGMFGNSAEDIKKYGTA